MLVNPSDGCGFVGIATVAKTVHALSKKYKSFGGVFGWEYFNALPGNTANPIQWAVDMAQAMQ